MKIAIYSRKSRLTEKGESVQNQIQMCKEYATTNFGSCEFFIYEDEGFSGGNIDRPAFNKMLIDIKTKKFNKLICYKLDRISRSVVDFSSTLELLSEHNVDFISITEHFDTGFPIGRAMLYISSVFAQLERETIAERIRDNISKLARTGIWLGGPAPIGYKLTTSNYISSNGASKKMTILTKEPDIAEQVVHIFQRFLKVRTITALVKTLKQEGIKAQKGGYYVQRTLVQILRNPVYVKSDSRLYEYYKKLGADVASEVDEFNGNGILINHKHAYSGSKHYIRNVEEWIIAVGDHPGIIDADTWLEVQSIMDANSKQYTRGRAGTSQLGLISTLLVCGDCGSKFRITYRSLETNGSVKHYYYKCRLKASEPESCKIKNINGRDADQKVISYLLKIANQDNDQILKLLESSQEELSQDSKELAKQKESFENQIEYLNKKIERLTEQLSNPESDTTIQGYILKQIKKHDEEIQSIKQLLYANDELFYKKTNQELWLRKLIEFKNNIDNLDLYTKKSYLRELIKMINWDGEELGISLNT